MHHCVMSGQSLDVVNLSGTHQRKRSSVSCAECRLNKICLPIALNSEELDRLDDVIQRDRPQEKGDYLYHMGDSFKTLYAVRSGSFKTYMVSECGVEQITGFYLPGDVMGIDGVAQGRYTNHAVALEHSAVCRVPYSQLESLSHVMPTLQRNIFRIMGCEITREQKMMTLLGSCTAEQKVASFLLSLSRRKAERGLSPTNIHLTMSRGDIANYLGLTIETVSRLFNRFKKRNILSIDNKSIVINDLDILSSCVSPEQEAV